MGIVVIDPAGDLIIEFSEKREDIQSAHAGELTHRTEQFKVCKSALKEASEYFRIMLADSSKFAESSTDVIHEKGHIAVSEVWLRVIHKKSPKFDIPLDEIWYLAEAINYYRLDITTFNPWFATWYQKADFKGFRSKLRQLLFPTWRFDHAKGFMMWTRALAYVHVGHITEKNPTRLGHHHLPPRIIRTSSIYIWSFPS